MGAKLLLIQLLLMGGKIVLERPTSIDDETRWTAPQRATIAKARPRTTIATAAPREDIA